MRIKWSSAAVADLPAITSGSSTTGDREGEPDSPPHLRSGPESANDALGGCYGRLENTRELVIPRLPYPVVYQTFEECLIVLNVLHGAQRWP